MGISLRGPGGVHPPDEGSEVGDASSRSDAPSARVPEGRSGSHGRVEGGHAVPARVLELGTGNVTSGLRAETDDSCRPLVGVLI